MVKAKSVKSKRPAPKRVRAVLDLLEELYPDARCSLDFVNPLQLLVATILSAQCTDQRVNLVTPALFKRYPDVNTLAEAEIPDLEEMIRSTGFFRNKAKSIKGMARAVSEKHGGEIPGSLDELVKLPGVGRKTANVILGNAFGVPGITVDTHVGRLSRRLGFTGQDNPVKVEFDLMEIIPKELWVKFSHQMILHGRNLCKSRKPDCGACPVRPHCPEGEKQTKN